MLKDFLAKQPIDVIINTEISDTRVVLPIKVEPDGFYRLHKDNIEDTNLTPEKSIYVGSTHESQPYQSASALLNSKIKY